MLEDIEMIKQNVKEKQLLEMSMVEEEKQQMDKQKQALRRQLEKRSIEQGVATRNQRDVVVNLVFEDGSREKELKTEKKHGFPIVEVLDLDLEEDRDRLQVEILLKRYNKVLRFLFHKYANTGKQCPISMAY